MAVEQAAFVGGKAFAFLESLNRHFKLQRHVQRQDKTKKVVGVGGGEEKEIRWLEAGSPHQSLISIQVTMAASKAHGRGLMVSEARASSRLCAMHLSPDPKTAAAQGRSHWLLHIMSQHRTQSTKSQAHADRG